MADLYLKALESERRKLWAECRLKGLPKGTPERERIVEIDALLKAHKAKKDGKSAGQRRPPFSGRLSINPDRREGHASYRRGSDEPRRSGKACK